LETTHGRSFQLSYLRGNLVWVSCERVVSTEEIICLKNVSKWEKIKIYHFSFSIAKELQIGDSKLAIRATFVFISIILRK